MIKGRGDVFDTSGRIASIKGAALNMPVGASSEGTVNLSAENEDLKVNVPNTLCIYYSDIFGHICVTLTIKYFRVPLLAYRRIAVLLPCESTAL